MRKLRGLYTTVVYILATPPMMLAAMIMIASNINHPVRACKGCYEGFKLGHNSAMKWVKGE